MTLFKISFEVNYTTLFGRNSYPQVIFVEVDWRVRVDKIKELNGEMLQEKKH